MDRAGDAAFHIGFGGQNLRMAGPHQHVIKGERFGDIEDAGHGQLRCEKPPRAECSVADGAVQGWVDACP